jgi:hypothetical protein
VKRDGELPSGCIVNERVRGSGLEQIDGEWYYTVADVDQMAPFLMSLVSDGDRWMFVSSSGALTAGRGDADQALFPYVTDDRLHANGGQSGPVTRLLVTVGGEEILWIPFTARPTAGTRRFVSKSIVGDSVIFEEHRADLGMRFRYRWSSSATHGFVRTSTVENTTREQVRVAALDGLVDVLPYGLEPTVYQRLSNLSNAYKRSELVDPVARLAIYSLETPVSDRPEPEEVLRATVVWSVGLDGPISLDPQAIARFEEGENTSSELVTGVPGAYLVSGDIELDPATTRSWQIVADVGYAQSDVVRLRHDLRPGPDAGPGVGSDAGSGADPVAANDVATMLDDESRGTAERLVDMMTRADASQITGDPVACAHHFANVTYNVMRGGVPLDGYRIDVGDLVDFVGQRNRHVASRHAAFFATLPERIERRDLLERIAVAVADTGDVHLARLAEEYLPFSFSRRHGDPSRPWNKFSIRVVDEAGDPVVYYEGNWRDVFQNWEALCESYPEYLPGVVTLFVDASTADGYNPYRITRDGIDWEVPDPDDPWSNIGYWGDHQIVYLLRLLEATERYQPGEIARRLDLAAYTYADVPYRIAPYDDLVRDPKATIEFDDDAHAASMERVADLGGDGKLLADAEGRIVVVSLLEKLLVPVLAKLSNFVPGGGIWMNTQRPEWNDANNALVGNGLSMVTLFHLRRYLAHLRSLAVDHGGEISISSEVVAWFDALRAALASSPTGRGPGAGAEVDVEVDVDRQRRDLMDRLGRAACDHRSAIAASGFSGATQMVAPALVVELCDAAIGHLDATIEENWRADGLVHSYNIVHFPTDQTATVSPLPEMLEGQVAALASGGLSAGRQADLLDALFESALVRPDLGTFLLAPVQRPKAFLAKNVIDADLVEANALLSQLVAADDRSVIRADLDGVYRFAPDLTTAPTLRERLDHLGSTERWASLVEHESAAVLEIYESVFQHRAYIGRSGSMYAYEGIGSVYWHMVTKLLLAVQEAMADAVQRGDDDREVERLRDAYWRVHAGLGVNKSAAEFGAIPTDPYSHTPAHAGAQQPGMTGAVKEEMLARRRELGIGVLGGRIVFDTLLLRDDELLDAPTEWTVPGVDHRDEVVQLPAGAVGSTLCQVPIVVEVGDGDAQIDVEFADGRTERHRGDRLERSVSALIFGRTGDVRQVRVTVGRAR